MPQPLSPPTSAELELRGWRAKEWGVGEGMVWAATSQHPALGPEQDIELKAPLLYFMTASPYLKLFPN